MFRRCERTLTTRLGDLAAPETLPHTPRSFAAEMGARHVDGNRDGRNDAVGDGHHALDDVHPVTV